MKTCMKCMRTRQLDDFYEHPAMRDGRLGACKECVRAAVRANRQRRREYYRAYDRLRANEPQRVSARRTYATTSRGRATRATAKATWLRSNRFKRLAQNAANNAVRDGLIKRQPCEVCGASRAQKHHDNYSRPFDIRWLCSKHHSEHHKRLRGH